MARIQKGFALTTAIFGTLCFIFGMSLSIIAWVLAGKVPSKFTYSDTTHTSPNEKYFGTYWWGGLIYIVPGVIGIIAGCTRNTVAMVFYLVFNLICLLCSVVDSVLAALVVFIWAAANVSLNREDICRTTLSGNCKCVPYYDRTFEFYGTPCESLKNIQTLLGAMIALSCILSLLAFIASYISCCSLCNQEQESIGVIIHQGGGAYQPPAMVISHTSIMSAADPGPPGYSQQQYYPQHDKSKLVKNEVI